MAVFQILILILFFLLTYSSVYSSAPKNTLIVYFYSSTCDSCRELEGFVTDMEKENTGLEIKKFDIVELKNRSLLNMYSKRYNVSQSDFGTVPVFFIHDRYISGDDASDINSRLQKELERTDAPDTAVLDYAGEDYDPDVSRFQSLKLFGVILAGLLNGINPCSMSMLLFLASLLTVNNLNVLKIGSAYSLGKFFTYLLLGTLLFNVLSKWNVPLFHYIIKLLMLLFVVILVVLNLNDYFSAKHEKYGKIKLQLPVRLRRFNHGIIRKAVAITNGNLLIFLTFLLGIIVSFGEFLCTGQVYMATIITVFQTNTVLNLTALIYLIVYNICAIVPLLLISFIIYKGKEIFSLSEFIRQRLHIIKLLYALIFIVFGIIVWIN